ncbi:5267_t:CDS:2 [Funneliformis geosporum]|uniref:Chromatin modification-related protein EAF3 n=1 Tax=Funneliformis geosporum TaxID=1117311 RepID=A0A9W4SDF7_9GLOM|nr:5267_t:CDS:2 [Funneliformis geosporum]
MEVEFKHSDFISTHTTSSSIDDSELVLQGLSTDFANFVNELLSHQNGKNGLIRCYGITQDPVTKEYALVIRCIERDLKSYLYSSLPYPEYDWKTKLEILADIAFVINRIHDAGFIHKNLHTGNLKRLMNSTILTEISLNNHGDDSPTLSHSNGVYGVLPYVAPEVLRGGIINKAADIYSLGMVMWEVAVQRPPFDLNAHDKLLAQRICCGLRPHINNSMPKSLAKLIKRCWDANPLNRPEAEEVYIWVQWCTYHQMVSFCARLQNTSEPESHWSVNNSSDIFKFGSQLSRPPSIYAENNKDSLVLTPPPHKVKNELLLEYSIPGAYIADNIEVIDNWDDVEAYIYHVVMILIPNAFTIIFPDITKHYKNIYVMASILSDGSLTDVSSLSSPSSDSYDSSGNSSPNVKLRYQKGEEALCYHGPTVYVAQILDTRILYTSKVGEVGPQYHVHYKGWNKKWDEWVPESRLLKKTQENIDMYMMPRKHFIMEPSEHDLIDNIDNNKRRSKEDESDSEGCGDKKNPKLRSKRIRLSVDISIEEKVRMVDEWQWVTKNQLIIHPMPREKTVDDILKEFLDWYLERLRERNKITKQQELDVEDDVEDFKEFFNEALPVNLLYRFERQQFVELVEKYPELSYSSIYGAEHLMRLIVKIPDLVFSVQMKEEKAEEIQVLIKEMIEFIQLKCKTYYAAQYEPADPAYIRIIWEY